MRITVDLDPKDLDEVSRLTGIDKKSPAVAQAVHEYLRQKEREAFLKSVLAGETDYALSNEAVEAATKWDVTSSKGSCQHFSMIQATVYPQLIVEQI